MLRLYLLNKNQIYTLAYLSSVESPYIMIIKKKP